MIGEKERRENRRGEDKKRKERIEEECCSVVCSRFNDVTLDFLHAIALFSPFIYFNCGDLNQPPH